MAEVFEFCPDWHRHNQAVQLVRQYDLKLTSVLDSYPELQDCVAHCCHCGIRFLTFRCNRGRQDLRCPFGCRQHHRRQQANARSRKHYRTVEGKQRKEARNALRSPIDQPERTAEQEHPACKSLGPQEAPAREVPRERLAAAREHEQSDHGLADLSPNETCSLELAGVTLTYDTLVHSPVLSYLCQVVGLLERRTIVREELLETLRQSLRQRSLGVRARREYVLSYLHEHPPP